MNNGGEASENAYSDSVLLTLYDCAYHNIHNIGINWYYDIYSWSAITHGVTTLLFIIVSNYIGNNRVKGE